MLVGYNKLLSHATRIHLKRVARVPAILITVVALGFKCHVALEPFRAALEQFHAALEPFRAALEQFHAALEPFRAFGVQRLRKN